MAGIRPICGASMLLACLSKTLCAWSWAPAEQYAPPASLFVNRGTAQVSFGAAYAAPGAPPEQQALYGVIRYRDSLESFRSYDLFFSPSLAVWKFLRYESDGTTTVRYVGGFHYDNCGDGYVTATDRVFMPAIGATTAAECAAPVTSVRTNYGCMNAHFSNPFPIDNYQGAGSGSGVLPALISAPSWNAATQTLTSTTLPRPWIYYDGVLDPNSPRFLQDFLFCPDRTFIQQQVAAALDNVRLENQIRIYPDGTIMLTHLWTDLVNRPWRAAATDGYWMAPDSAPNGRVFYYNPNTNQYVEPFAGGQNPAGLYLTSGNGWVGYFIDTIQPALGMGFYYYPPGGIGIFPANNWPSSPSVLHTDYFTGLSAFGQSFRQMFILLGTKEEMQTRLAALDDYVLVFDPAAPPPFGNTLVVRPTSIQDADIIPLLGVVDATTPFGKWGKYGGGPCVQVGIHSLPCGLFDADISQARLRIARTDNIWTAETSSLNLNMLLRHIDAAGDAAVTLADGTSPPLGIIATYRQPGPYTLDNARYLDLDVTQQVKADLAAGRSSFAWRIEPQSVPDTVSSQRYIPTSDNSDAAFPPEIRGARLTLQILPPTWGCPDRDGDGDVDQSDFGVFQRCINGPGGGLTTGCSPVDFDHDNDVDGNDFTVFERCLSGADLPYNPVCTR